MMFVIFLGRGVIKRAISIMVRPQQGMRVGALVMRKWTSKALVGAIAAASFIFSSSAATAATAAPQLDPLAVLSVMSGVAPMAPVSPKPHAAPSGVQNVGSSAIPVPPPEVGAGGFGATTLLLGLAGVLGAVGLFVALHHGNHAVSPD
jgi:hypothetical protein